MKTIEVIERIEQEAKFYFDKMDYDFISGINGFIDNIEKYEFDRFVSKRNPFTRVSIKTRLNVEKIHQLLLSAYGILKLTEIEDD